MKNDLEFIPTIARELRANGSRRSLTRIFAELRHQDDSDGKSDAGRSFETFMAEVGAAFAQDALSQLEDSFKIDLMQSLLQSVNSNSEDVRAAMVLLQADPQWSSILNLLNAEIAPHSHDDITVNLVLDGSKVESFTLSPTLPNGSFSPIEAGSYAVELETGLLLWERRITEQDVRWTRAHGRRPFRVAASTESENPKATIDDTILDGVFRILVFPGIEHGRLDITWRPPAGGMP